MCFRLLAAVSPRSDTNWEALAFAHGLDVRVAEQRTDVQFMEIAWGDCACSLYTRKEGQGRFSRWVEAVRNRGMRLQLLLLVDDQQVDWSEAQNAQVDMNAIRARGVQALTEGRVTEVM